MNRVRQLLTSLNCDGAAGVALLLACALLLLPELGGDSGRLLLRYDRIGLAAGQWWRLLSAHVVHLDFEHALLNSLGLVLMWALFASDYPAPTVAPDPHGRHRRNRCRTVVTRFDRAVVRGFLGCAAWSHGCGYSGARASARSRRLAAGPFLLIKLTYEQLSGALPLVSAPGGVVVDAHLYGALGGLAVALLLRPRREPP